jgi:hypothetical protein
MKLKIALFLLMCGIMLSNSDKPSQTAQCLADCKGRCTATLDSCKQKATSKTALAACQKSHDLCASICVNKTCSSAPAK